MISLGVIIDANFKLMIHLYVFHNTEKFYFLKTHLSKALKCTVQKIFEFDRFEKLFHLLENP